MRPILICEMIALLTLPFPMAVLRRRGVNFEKPMAFAIATLCSLFVGTYWIFLMNPKTLFSITSKDWLTVMILSLFCWVFVYLISRWLHKQWLS